MKNLLRMVTLGLLVGILAGYSTSCSSVATNNCTYGQCPPQCGDGIQNAPETDIDCGGAICIECPLGKKCNIGADCLSAVCAAGVCSEPSCTDGVLGGTETDIDCGGSCGKCATGRGCSGAGDCTTGVCTGNRCAAPSCTDKVKNGTETDVDCGGSCAPCALGGVCTANSDCAPLLCDNGKCGLGSGGDGPLNVAAGMNQTTNSIASAATGAKGATSLTLGSATGFATGQNVFIHQTQGTGAGNSELNRIAAINGTTATLVSPLANAYTTGAQTVVVQQYTTVTVAATGTVVAPAWNGTTGGIMIFQASGSVTIDGTVSMGARGFRGGGDPVNCFPGSPTGSIICGTLHGRFGESEAGSSTFGTADNAGYGVNNGSGGGGGTRGMDCAAGGGASHATGGSPGADGSLGLCIANLRHGGGLAGNLLGGQDLTRQLFVGGGGGEGGPDEDGTHPGVGGNGGGIIVILASSLTVSATGTIESNGGGGMGGMNAFPGCGGGGAGMGNGGGGAGGAIRLFTAGATSLGSGRITTLGGGGSAGGGCGAGSPGGNGGLGRIHVRPGAAPTGMTNPPAYVD